MCCRLGTLYAALYPQFKGLDGEESTVKDILQVERKGKETEGKKKCKPRQGARKKGKRGETEDEEGIFPPREESLSGE